MSDALDETLPGPSAPAGDAAAAFGVGTHVAGRYRIDRFIASGAMGEVFAAEDLIVGGMVALKTVRPELEGSATAMERLRREIALARKVTNAHICRMHDVGEHANRAFITMELLDGKTLAEVVAERGALPIAEVDRIAEQLIDGLAALHAHGIVHRDFKTSNVILVGPRAVITDFGLARSIRPDAMASLTVEASLLGTPAYMAPEQVEGRAATPASDVYALGIVLFELLTGTVPFREDTALATATARLQRDPPKPSSVKAGIPSRWDARVLACLAREPAERVALADVLDAKVPSRRWFIAATAAGLAGVGVGAWRLFASGDDEAGPLAADGLVAVLPPAGNDPIALAIAVDLHDALATTGLPIVGLDASAMTSSPTGTAMQLAKSPDPFAAAFAIPKVAAVARVKLAGTDPLALDVTVRRRGGAAWSKRFTRAASEAMLLVEDVAIAIASSLHGLAVRHAADAVATSADVYRAYGAGLATLFDQKAPATTPLEAVPLARAQAWLAERLAITGQEASAIEERARAREAADRALAIDPENALALAARGRAALFQWDWAIADAATRRAVELAPTNARAVIARSLYLLVIAQFDEGIALLEKNLALNPRAPAARGLMGWGYYFGRRYQKAIDQNTPLFDTDPIQASYLVLAYAEMSRYDDALAAAKKLRASSKDPIALAAVVPAYVNAGDLAEARKIIDEVKTTARPYTVALALDALDDLEGALAILEKLVAERNSFSVYLNVDRFSSALRSHARFQALLAKVGFPA